MLSLKKYFPYEQYNSSSIQFIFNEQPSIQKNFQTINYEGSAGWQVDHFYSDATEPNQTPYPLVPISSGSPSWIPNSDVTNPIASYDMGAYLNPNTQMPEHSGFCRKENRYVANLVNNSVPQYGEIVFGGEKKSKVRENGILLVYPLSFISIGTAHLLNVVFW